MIGLQGVFWVLWYNPTYGGVLGKLAHHKVRR